MQSGVVKLYLARILAAVSEISLVKSAISMLVKWFLDFCIYLLIVPVSHAKGRLIAPCQPTARPQSEYFFY